MGGFFSPALLRVGTLAYAGIGADCVSPCIWPSMVSRPVLTQAVRRDKYRVSAEINIWKMT